MRYAIPFSILLATSSARADGLRAEASFSVSYLIAGGSRRAPSTGGAALVPTVRLLYSMHLADPYIGASPILVTPYTLDAMGFVGAIDAGVLWHPDSRAWSIGTGATFAPSYMSFCNAVPWCLKEGVILYGGEAHFAGRILETANGGGLSAAFSARVLTGRPTAWTWPTLTPEERDVNRVSVMAGGGLRWRF